MPITITDPSEAASEIARRVERHNRIVFFGGAGVSTASGIPDFRSVDGLYHQKVAYPPETMLSHDFFETHTAEFYEFYRTKMIALGAKPNQAHLKLAELERAGKLTAVVTQNIDGLHQAAGSNNVLELHGSVHRNICQRCGHVYSAEWIMAREHEDANGVPVCPECGGPIKLASLLGCTVRATAVSRQQSIWATAVASTIPSYLGYACSPRATDVYARVQWEQSDEGSEHAGKHVYTGDCRHARR